MFNNQNPFDTLTGSDRVARPKITAIILSVLVVSAWLASKLGLIGVGVLISLPFISGYLYLLFYRPVIGIYTAVVLGFILLGLQRYLADLPFGMALDTILILTYLSLFFKKFTEGVNWTPVKRDITYLSAIWFGYYLLQVLNPEASSKVAWFAGRSVALYMFLLVPLTLLLIDTQKKLDTIIIIWGTFALLASIKGIMQVTIGADRWEMEWLTQGAYRTHILFGKLRAFGFMSDAGQFGANQAYTAVVASIYFTSQRKYARKFFFLVITIFSLYGMVISGTRGALSVPIVGFATYFILRKNFGIMISGFFILVLVFYFFKFTTIGQSNAKIRRMRSAFNPNNPSLLVRLENQKKLKVYLASRPFGGGIGHGGKKAKKYLPDAYLSQIATDSWYVSIWVEQGIVGLILHLFILFYVLIKSSYNIIFRIRDPILKIKITALTSGMAGIMVASYGNGVLGQIPTSVLIYISMAVMLNTEMLEPKVNEADMVIAK